MTKQVIHTFPSKELGKKYVQNKMYKPTHRNNIKAIKNAYR
jgi:hypothetical protein